ncbi:uncharacterized protein METZ01_LOCUS167155 [marine metagenome]|uniref:Uncharacterized protein n=1 Tax=marine metagenome TaxID=408172 RepID=A0A382BL85_9ZZZZ
MNLYLKNIAGGLILIIGLILFFSSLINKNINIALVSLTSSLLLWVIFGLYFDTFDVQIFSLVISSAGFLLAISVFFLYGVEEVAHPIGAIVFHSGGIAGSLGIGLFSLFPLLIMHQINSQSVPPKPNFINNSKVSQQESKLESDDWEIATEEELQSDEFEVG